MDICIMKIEKLWNALTAEGDILEREVFKNILNESGLHYSLVNKFINYLFDKEDRINYDKFCKIRDLDTDLLERVISGQLIIPSFRQFCSELEEIYHQVGSIKDGNKANYIPSLQKQNEEWWGVSICTIDGQVWSIGDIEIPFTLQSTVKPLKYGMVIEDLGKSTTDQHVGHEPSGREFNAVCFDAKNRPHNPMINSGAIMTCSLLRKDLENEPAERYNYVIKKIEAMAGIGPNSKHQIGFDNRTYLSELQHANRNYALAYLMEDQGVFPVKTNIQKTLEFYFQCCSLTCNAMTMANMASTLANGGISPITGDRVFKARTAQNVLSVMYSCGMYDFSGEFAYSIGFPCKSGVSGALLIVIPNIMGICTFSPNLDKQGNSVRGVEFCRKLVEKYNFHAFDSLKGSSKKKDPTERIPTSDTKCNDITEMCFAAASGNIPIIMQLVARDVDVNVKDYDMRTPLHIACAEGQKAVVKYLVKQRADVFAKDRWGKTPYDEAEQFGDEEILDILKKN